MDHTIILVGFMGTGKTVVGKALAEKLHWNYVDADDLIEEKAGKTIPEIFADDGEAHFRDLETEVLAELQDIHKTVVSAGGGAVLREENMGLMRKAGLVVCLQATPEVIYERTREFSHRPLLEVGNPLKRIRELLDFRKPFYAKAPHIIDTSELTIDEVVEKIIAIHQKNK